MQKRLELHSVQVPPRSALRVILARTLAAANRAVHRSIRIVKKLNIHPTLGRVQTDGYNNPRMTDPEQGRIMFLKVSDILHVEESWGTGWRVQAPSWAGVRKLPLRHCPTQVIRIWARSNVPVS